MSDNDNANDDAIAVRKFTIPIRINDTNSNQTIPSGAATQQSAHEDSSTNIAPPTSTPIQPFLHDDDHHAANTSNTTAAPSASNQQHPTAFLHHPIALHPILTPASHTTTTTDTADSTPAPIVTPRHTSVIAFHDDHRDTNDGGHEVEMQSLRSKQLHPHPTQSWVDQHTSSQHNLQHHHHHLRSRSRTLSVTSRPITADLSAAARVHFLSVFLWCGALMMYVSLGFYLTALTYDSWTELINDSNGKTVDKIRGKELAQYLLISIGCLFGVGGCIGLTGRLFGSPEFRAWLKLASIGTTIIMASLGYIATKLYPHPDKTIYPNSRLGAGFEYADSAFNYCCIAVAFLIAHEVSIRIVQRVRTQHHLASSAAERLRVLKHTSSPEVLHAKQAACTQAQVAAEIARKQVLKDSMDDSSSASALMTPSYAPPHSRPTSSTTGQDLHLRHLVDRLLHDKDKLTTSQLSLLFSLIIFFYLVQIGGCAYAAIEGWDLRTGIQFCVVTVATIGYGDITSRTTLGRALLFVYFPLGFGVMSYTISLLWTQLFTHAEEHMTQLYQFFLLYILRPIKLQAKGKEVRKEQEGRRAERERKENEIRHKKTKKQEREAEMMRFRKDMRGSSEATISTVTTRPHDHTLTSNGVADSSTLTLTSAEALQLAILPASSSTLATEHTAEKHRRPSHATSEELARLGPIETALLDEEEEQLARKEDEEIAEMEAELAALEEANATEDGQLDSLDLEGGDSSSSSSSSSHNDTNKLGLNTNQKLCLALVFVLFILLAGAAVFQYYEGWTYFEAVYFCFCTLTTIGYGDFSPTLPRTKTFAIYYIMAGLGALAYVLSLVNEKITARMEMIKEISAAAAKQEEEAEKKALEAERLELEALTSRSSFRNLSTLPTWNERFLATTFEMERLGELLQTSIKQKRAPTQAMLVEYQNIAETMKALSLTVGQRQSDESRHAAVASRLMMSPTAASIHGRTPGTRVGKIMNDDIEEEEVDLSSYGIRSSNATAFQQQYSSNNPNGTNNSTPDRVSTTLVPVHGGKKIISRIVVPVKRSTAAPQAQPHQSPHQTPSSIMMSPARTTTIMQFSKSPLNSSEE